MISARGRVARRWATEKSSAALKRDSSACALICSSRALPSRSATSRFTHRYDDWSSIEGETETERRFERGDWAVRTTTRTVLRSTETHFQVHAELDAWEGGVRVFSKNYRSEIARDLL